MARKQKGERPESTSVKEADSSEAPGEGAADRRPFDWWRENIEAFLIAVVLAVVIRHFAVEAFEIPTGSMANTLFGMHAWTTCPNCSHEYNVALQSDSEGQISVPYSRLLVYDGQCPNPNCANKLHSRGPRGIPLRGPGDAVVCGACGTRFNGDPQKYRFTEAYQHAARCVLCGLVVDTAVFEKSNRYGGHKILVTKFAYVVGKPQRWDVVVFEFDQWKNYIKRLVGLPGERIDVWDGDLYVNGSIERKYRSPRVQEALWTRISDSDQTERGLAKVPAWAEVAAKETKRDPTVSKMAQWDADQRRWRINALDEPVVLQYQRGFHNYYSYNLLNDRELLGMPSDIQVGDKKVDFTVNVLARGPARAEETERRPSWVGAEIRDGDFTFQLRIPVGSANSTEEAVLQRLQSDPGPAPSVDRPLHESGTRLTRPFVILPGVTTRVELENVDDRVTARVNGEEILSFEYVSLPSGRTPESHPPEPSTDKDGHYVRCIASHVQVELMSIGVYRDQYYISRRYNQPWGGIQLGEKEYFVMGDNAPSSQDGRYWGSVPEENLMGKAFVVFWPAWPLNFQCKFIR